MTKLAAKQPMFNVPNRGNANMEALARWLMQHGTLWVASTALTSALHGGYVRADTTTSRTLAIDHEVSLKRGEVIKGELVELVPNQWIQLVLPNGDLRKLTWAEVESHRSLAPRLTPLTVVPTSIDGTGLFSPKGDIGFFPTAVLPPSLSERDPTLIRVHLQSDHPAVQLHSRHNYETSPVSDLKPYIGFYDWELACADKCGVELSRSDSYSIRGPGVRSSESFQLPLTPTGELTLFVHAGRPSRHRGGKALTILGSIFLVYGAVALPFTYLFTSGKPESRTIGLASGGALLGSGLAMLIPGIILLVRNETHVSSSAGPLVFQ